MTPEDFIQRWQSSGGHERGSAQMFLVELLNLPHPENAHNSGNERHQSFLHFKKCGLK